MRKIKGIVVSDKMEKTRVVESTALKKHKRYEKYFRVSRRFKAHDEANAYKQGDEVVIQETRPMSREKRWVIVGKTEKKAEKIKEASRV